MNIVSANKNASEQMCHIKLKEDEKLIKKHYILS